MGKNITLSRGKLEHSEDSCSAKPVEDLPEAGFP